MGRPRPPHQLATRSQPRSAIGRTETGDARISLTRPQPYEWPPLGGRHRHPRRTERGIARRSLSLGPFDGVEIGEESIFPDPLSESLAESGGHVGVRGTGQHRVDAYAPSGEKARSD